MSAVSTRVAQGSHFRPAHSDLFFCDMPVHIKFSQLFLFAKGLKLVKFIRLPLDPRRLQSDIDFFVV